MHDIGGTLGEFGMESSYPEIPETGFEFETTQELGQSGEVASPFNEVQEMELASELLSVTNETELNHFLGDLIKKAAGAVGTIVKSPVGQALGGILKDAAKKALPIVGGALGGYFGGSGGADIGSKLASSAGRIFGLELEGLSAEDREFEAARQFVRYGGAASARAVRAPQNIQPQIAAKMAATLAARRYIPGLSGASLQPSQPALYGRSGRWIRRGRKIILLGI